MKCDNFQFIDKTGHDIIECKELVRENALKLLKLTKFSEVIYLGSWATRIKEHFHEQCTIEVCGAGYTGTSTWCNRGCSYCLWGADSPDELIEKPNVLRTPKENFEYAKKMKENGVTFFKLVGLGRTISQDIWNMVLESYKMIKPLGFKEVCASFGELSLEQLKQLKEAGVTQYNCNLETSRNFYSKICHANKWDDRYKTVQNAKKIGMRVCCGGIVGMGESIKDRLDLAFSLKKLNVDSLPFNVFVKTKKQHLSIKLPKPIEFLKTLAVFRLILPKQKIMCNAGRQNFRELHPFILTFGANGYAIRNYLTGNRDPNLDKQLLCDMGV